MLTLDEVKAALNTGEHMLIGFAGHLVGDHSAVESLLVAVSQFAADEAAGRAPEDVVSTVSGVVAAALDRTHPSPFVRMLAAAALEPVVRGIVDAAKKAFEAHFEADGTPKGAPA